MLVETPLRLWNLPHFEPWNWRVNLLRGAQFVFDLAAGKNCVLRRTRPHKLQNQSADCLGLMLSGSLGQSIQPFKTVWPFDSHLPIFSCVRSGDGYAPLSWFITQGVLYTRHDFPAQVRIPEMLQLDRHCHRTVILIKNLLSLNLCKPVKVARDGAVKRTFEQLIHNFC